MFVPLDQTYSHRVVTQHSLAGFSVLMQGEEEEDEALSE
jgi:hypothetical protein